MLRVPYKIVARGPIHTGGEGKMGTVSPLRRERRAIELCEIESNFSNTNDRVTTLATLVQILYKSASDGIKSSYGGYDAVASTILASCNVETRHAFLNKVMEGLGIRVLSYKDGQMVKAILDLFSCAEFLGVMRDEHQYINLVFREFKEDGRLPTIPVTGISKSVLKYRKAFADVPFISGNSIRGIFRRLVMRDFFERIGADGVDVAVTPEMYHQLMTGGNLTSSTAFEDMDKRDEYVRLCPMIGLLGSAIGNMTIQGDIKVAPARPRCTELGSGSVSFWSLISTEFGTRLDSSKTERHINVENKAEGAPANQMKYEYEVLIAGTEMDAEFALVTDDPLYVSAFWYGLQLLKRYGFLGGKSSTYIGDVCINIEIPVSAERLYLQHMKDVKDAAREFFTVPV